MAAAQEKRDDGLRHWRPGEAARFRLVEDQLRGQAVAPCFEALAAPGRYVGCARDLVVRPEFQRSVADVTLDCGHLPQVHCPAQLADAPGA